MIRVLPVVFLLLAHWGSAQIQTMGLFLNDTTSFNGYTLFSPSANQNVYLIDNCGELVHDWPTNIRPGLSAYLLESGDLIRAGQQTSVVFGGGGIGGRIQVFDWDGSMTWDYVYASDSVHQHHDFEVLPNGNVLVLAWEFRTGAEALSAGRDPNLLNNELWPEHIVEVEPVGATGGNIVWEWHLWDHLVQDFDSSQNNFGIVADHPELVNLNFVPDNAAPDWIHANSIDYHPGFDQIIINSRVFGEFWVIDHSTTTAEAASHSGGNSGKGGDLLYRWGNPQAYDRGQDFDQQLYGPHDANWIPEGYPDAGKIIVFNNGTNRPGGVYSSVEVIDPPVDQNGNYTIIGTDAFGPVNPDWIYVGSPSSDFFSFNISGAQRLPNGNTLICEGAEGHFFEVDANDQVVWDYISPIAMNGPLTQGGNIAQNAVFRTYRYATDFAGLQGKDLTPSGPLEQNPLPSDCEIYTSVKPIDGPLSTHWSVYPNPARDQITIDLLDGRSANNVEVIDLTGRVLQQHTLTNSQETLDISRLPSGLYLIKAEGFAPFRLAKP